MTSAPPPQRSLPTDPVEWMLVLRSIRCFAPDPVPDPVPDGGLRRDVAAAQLASMSSNVRAASIRRVPDPARAPADE